MNTIFTYKKLYLAYLDCRKNKRKTINALKFEWNMEDELRRLRKELGAGTYRPGRSICFVVTRPVPREIMAADFRDRVVHHLLIREIIKYGERSFVYDSYACRPGKGTHKAVKRLRKFIKIAKQKGGQTHYAQLDISGFFMGISQDCLYELVKKLIIKQRRGQRWKDEILWLAERIIFHKPRDNYAVKGQMSLFSLIPNHKSLLKQPDGQGLPIGNYTSQFFANLYLNELDQFIKRNLKRRYYIRYVDDFIILGQSAEQLKIQRDKIDLFLKNKLNLKLNRNKTRIQPVERGIDFLGYFIKPEYILSRQKVVRRLKNKLYQIDKTGTTKCDLAKILAQINSYYGHFRQAVSFNLRKRVYDNYLGELQDRFFPKDNFVSLGLEKKIN